MKMQITGEVTTVRDRNRPDAYPMLTFPVETQDGQRTRTMSALYVYDQLNLGPPPELREGLSVDLRGYTQERTDEKGGKETMIVVSAHRVLEPGICGFCGQESQELQENEEPGWPGSRLCPKCHDKFYLGRR